MNDLEKRAWSRLTADMAGGAHQYDYWEDVPASVRKRYVDRELTRLAAKAAGATEYGGPHDYSLHGLKIVNGDVLNYEGAGEFGYRWDPLNDDGEALRLAVRLGMTVIVALSFVAVSWGVNDALTESIFNDACAATRRAIVRAAAEMAKD